MTDIETIAAHHLYYDEGGAVADETDHAPFDAERYSRMKYGDRDATRAFATELAGQLCKEVPDTVNGNIPPQFLVAYKAVPPACYYLSRYCLDTINAERVANSQEPGRILQVYKSKVAATNYAGASAEERIKELSTIDFSLEGRDISDLPVAVLDDIRITGAAERRILDVIQPARPSAITLGYIALFNPNQASVCPSVENDLNGRVIRGIESLDTLVASDNFDVNIRTLKLVLGSGPEKLREFLDRVPAATLEVMLRGSIDTGPDFVAQYRTGFAILTTVANERGL